MWRVQLPNATQFGYDNILCQLMRFFAFACAPTSIESFITRSNTHTQAENIRAVSLIMQLSMKCGKLSWFPMVSHTANISKEGVETEAKN